MTTTLRDRLVASMMRLATATARRETALRAFVASEPGPARDALEAPIADLLEACIEADVDLHDALYAWATQGAEGIDALAPQAAAWLAAERDPRGNPHACFDAFEALRDAALDHAATVAAVN